MAESSIYGAVLIHEAMASFGNIIAPISAFSSATDYDALNVGDTVRVPFSTPNSASNNFTYASGYGTGLNTNLGVRSVTLNNIAYQRFVINDADHSKLSSTSIQTIVRQAGERLAGDVISASFASVISDVNFPTSASCTSGQLTSSNALADLVTQADNALWTTDNRNLILSPSGFNSLIKNTSLNQAFSFGGAQVVQNAAPTNVYGFNVYKSTVAMPNNCKGLVLNPNAVLFGTGQHKPSDISKPNVNFAVSTAKGVTITMKSWYDPVYAQTVYILECLFGAAVGNNIALYQMK